MKRVRVGRELATQEVYLIVGSERVKLSPAEAIRVGQALQNEGVNAKLELMKADSDG
jgi:hypothetical protein